MAIWIFYEVVYNKSVVYIQLWSWVLVDLGLQFDSLTAIMLVIITSISMLVHIYSTEYMKEDPHLPRFMSYLSLFTWFMIILVTADNLIQLFIGWEGVGLCSYLLINFWFTRIQANKAAMKAMIVNRIGDVGVVIAIIYSYYIFGSVNYDIIFFISEDGDVDFIAAMLLVGAIGKSAQLGLHTWLPDAMEGPTPVSALIHAATMVTAGVFLLLRCSSILELSPIVLSMISFVGAATAFFAATVGLVQNDIKKVIAYSTCSQLGYMVFACGISAYSTSFFHLFNHAFFKALLFLSAGSVIHALGDEQDLRKMGAVISKLPFTYSMLFLGSLSLMGFPFFTGFYSKDAIIELAYASFSLDGSFAHWLGAISAMFTAFYSMRLLNLAFLQVPLGDKVAFNNAHEPGFSMSFPLLVLAFASVFIGFLFKDLFLGPASPFILFEGWHSHLQLEAEFLPLLVKWLPFFLSIIGAISGLLVYPFSSSFLHVGLYTFLANKWNFDQVLNQFVVFNILDWGYSVAYKILDRGLIEVVGPFGLSRLFYSFAVVASSFQSGQIYHYSFAIIIGTVFALLLAV